MTGLKTRVRRVDAAALAEAADLLRAGGLVAFPTETVYGLGADATNSEAVERLYAVKGRPAFNPLIVHVADLASARALAIFDPLAERLATAFWPGPLTLVLPQSPGCPVAKQAMAGLPTIALRVPASAEAQALLRAFGGALVAPSANLSGHVSPTLAAHVRADLDGLVPLVLDGGAAMVGVESSIVACLHGAPALLRPGGLSGEAIEAALSHPLTRERQERGAQRAPTAPGQLQSHYAPRARLRTEASRLEPGEALLAFGPSPLPGAEAAVATLNLSPQSNLEEAAANLFAFLRRLDASGVTMIAVMPIPSTGLGEAINDRLRRAAAPRPAPHAFTGSTP